jgi:hypothetical protein
MCINSRFNHTLRCVPPLNILPECRLVKAVQDAALSLLTPVGATASACYMMLQHCQLHLEGIRLQRDIVQGAGNKAFVPVILAAGADDVDDMTLPCTHC